MLTRTASLSATLMVALLSASTFAEQEATGRDLNFRLAGRMPKPLRILTVVFWTSESADVAGQYAKYVADR